MATLRKLLDVCYKSGNNRCRLVIRNNNKVTLTAYEPLSFGFFYKHQTEFYCNDTDFLRAALRSFFVNYDLSKLIKTLESGQKDAKYRRYSFKSKKVCRCPITFKYMCFDYNE